MIPQTATNICESVDSKLSLKFQRPFDTLWVITKKINNFNHFLGWLSNIDKYERICTEFSRIDISIQKVFIVFKTRENCSRNDDHVRIFNRHYNFVDTLKPPDKPNTFWLANNFVQKRWIFLFHNFQVWNTSAQKCSRISVEAANESFGLPQFNHYSITVTNTHCWEFPQKLVSQVNKDFSNRFFCSDSFDLLTFTSSHVQWEGK